MTLLIFGAYTAIGLWCAWVLLKWVVKYEGEVGGVDMFIAACMVAIWPVLGPIFAIAFMDWGWLTDFIQERLDRKGGKR